MLDAEEVIFSVLTIITPDRFHDEGAMLQIWLV